MSVARFARDPRQRLSSHHVDRPMSEDDRVAGFDAGADDYMTKPFSLRSVHGSWCMVVVTSSRLSSITLA
jgi:DNA-binding response OmpR family regulator